MVSPAEYEPSGRGVWVFLGVLLAVSIGTGIRAYHQYSRSERVIQAALTDFDGRGAELDVSGCVDGVLEWYADCDAMPVLCETAVPMSMTRCLAAQDRTAACEELGDSYSGSFTFERCNELEQDLGKRCDEAWRAFDSFCRNDQRGVRL